MGCRWCSVLCDSSEANGLVATMKELAVSHRKELEMYSDLDMAAIDKVTYLFDFDRAVQCVLPSRSKIVEETADAVLQVPDLGLPYRGRLLSRFLVGRLRAGNQNTLHGNTRDR